MSRLVTAYATLAVALVGAGCSSAVPAGIGVVAPPTIEATPDAERYVVGPDQATVEAQVSAGASYTLTFARQTGTLVVSPGKPEASTVDFLVQTESAESSLGVVADIAKDQFLHSVQFPIARFTSSSLRKRPDGTFDLYGELELCGTKKSLVVPATIAINACRIEVKSEFAVDRHVFGAVSDGSFEGLVSDMVTLRIQADVRRSSAPPSCKKKLEADDG